MNNLIDETLKSLSDEYDKLYLEQQKSIKKLEELASKHQIVSELKARFESSLEKQKSINPEYTPSGGTIIVKNKEK